MYIYIYICVCVCVYKYVCVCICECKIMCVFVCIHVCVCVCVCVHNQTVSLSISCHLFITGIGYGMVLISGIVCIYYNIIITWTIFYLIHSFFPVLPWSTCNNWWNTDKCALRTPDGVFMVNGSQVATYNASSNQYGPVNASLLNDTKLVTPSEFWK